MPRGTRHLVLVFVYALPLSTAHAIGGEIVTGPENRFTFVVPDGFVAAPELVPDAPDILFRFAKGDLTDDEPDLLLFIEKMHGWISQERLTQESLPPGSNVKLLTAHWRGFEIDAFEVPESMDVVDFVTFNAQVPLRKNAVQIKAFGPADRRAEVKAALEESLRGLDGETNWHAISIPPNIAQSEYYRYVLLAVAALIVLGGLICLWFVSRYLPRGVLVGIAFLIWLVGSAIAQSEVRELMLIGGSLQMLGFASGIAGLIDTFRKRSPRKQAAKANGSTALGDELERTELTSEHEILS